MKQSPDSPYKNLLFRETFRSEQEVRKNGGTPTDVSFKNGIASKISSNSKIHYNSEFINTNKYSLRLKVKLKGNVGEIINSHANSDNNTSCRLFYNINGLGFWPKSGFVYYYNGPKLIKDDWSEITITVSDSEIIYYINGESVHTSTGVFDDYIGDWYLGYFNSYDNFNADYELVEVYDRALTASEVSNLYSNTWNKEITGMDGQLKSGNLVKNGFDWIDSNNDGLADNFIIEADVGAIPSIVKGQRIEISQANINEGNYWRVNLQSTATKSLSDFPIGTKILVKFKGRANTNINNMAYRTGSTSTWHTFNLTTDWKDYEFELSILDNSTTWLNTFVISSSGFQLGNWFEIDEYSLQILNPKTLIDFNSTNGILDLGDLNDSFTATDVAVKKIGNSYSAEFNGTTSMIDTGTTFNGLTQTITGMVWIKPYSNGEGGVYGQILCNDGLSKFSLTMYGDINGWFIRSDGSSTVPSLFGQMKMNKWQFLAFTRAMDGTANLYYGDLYNAPILSGAADRDSGTPIAGTTNVIIGNNAAQNRTFDGKIAKLKVVEGILSLDEITRYWSSTRGDLE